VVVQLTPDEREMAGRSLLEALQYTASQGVVHRDLKPANVLFCSDDTASTRRLVVGDFGLARSVSDRSQTLTLTRRVGMPLFWAPEVDNEEHYGLAADIFSAGLPAACVSASYHAMPCSLLPCPLACEAYSIRHIRARSGPMCSRSMTFTHPPLGHQSLLAGPRAVRMGKRLVVTRLPKTMSFRDLYEGSHRSW